MGVTASREEHQWVVGGGRWRVTRRRAVVEVGRFLGFRVGLGLGLQGGRAEEEDGHGGTGALAGCGRWPSAGHHRRRAVVRWRSAVRVRDLGYLGLGDFNRRWP
jgi:hypothetical protein